MRRSANSRHSYSFPRIYGIMNDGTVSYDTGKDGQGQEVGSCSVCLPYLYGGSESGLEPSPRGI